MAENHRRSLMEENFQLAESDKNRWIICAQLFKCTFIARGIFPLFFSEKPFVAVGVAWCTATAVARECRRRRLSEKLTRKELRRSGSRRGERRKTKAAHSVVSTHKTNIKQLCNYEIFFHSFTSAQVRHIADIRSLHRNELKIQFSGFKWIPIGRRKEKPIFRAKKANKISSRTFRARDRVRSSVAIAGRANKFKVVKCIFSFLLIIAKLKIYFCGKKISECECNVTLRRFDCDFLWLVEWRLSLWKLLLAQLLQRTSGNFLSATVAPPSNWFEEFSVKLKKTFWRMHYWLWK